MSVLIYLEAPDGFESTRTAAESRPREARHEPGCPGRVGVEPDRETFTLPISVRTCMSTIHRLPGEFAGSSRSRMCYSSRASETDPLNV